MKKVCLFVLLAACLVQAKEKPEEVNDDGLIRVEHSLLEELYVSPNAPLSHYKRVSIDPIEVTFRKGWRKEHPEVSDKQFADLCDDLAKSLREALVAELARGGYALTDAADPDVLRVRASIEKVEFAGVEKGGEKKTWAYEDNSKMQLRVQAFDAPSSVLVARAKDYVMAPRNGLQAADIVTANKVSRRIFEKWAVEFRSALDVSHLSTGEAQAREEASGKVPDAIPLPR
ncbi:MAG TPA: DUF3313 family protein [Steroidobacteraceae bacterium]|nr:DUF3313 family protein [Steroidobacteraceae bacterium]